MKRMSRWIVTPDGLGVGTAGLALSGAATSAGYFWGLGTGIVRAAGVVAVLSTVILLAAFLRAAWERTLRPRWWPLIVPAYLMGLLLGLIAAPFAALEIEAGVFMALLVGPVLLIVLVWIVLWTAILVARAHRHRVAGEDDRAIVVSAS
jgi:hypothetical protein